MYPYKPKYVATTPRLISPAIAAFCESISPEQPVYLEVTPSSFAQIGRCYLNAEYEADRIGGEPTLGWLIWELPGVFLTAEHHAVIEVDGKYIDVTPQFNSEKRVLFLPDHDGDFSPPRPANQYKGLSADPRIERFLKLKRRNSILELTLDFGPEYQANDAETTRLLDSFYGRDRDRADREARRKRKKAERQRKKRNR